MSGGTFDYLQHRMAEAITTYADNLVEMESSLPTEVVVQLIVGLQNLQAAAIYMQRADWLFACDDGPETFLRRLRQDVKDAPDWSDILSAARKRRKATDG